jgi:hypothetical protein
MSLSFRGVRDAGNLQKERLVLVADGLTSVGASAIFRAKSGSDAAIYPEVSHAFWFPDLTAKDGDLIVIYTKEGKDSTKENSNGSTSHFFYWDISTPLWTEAGYVPILIKIETWKAYHSAHESLA